MVNLNNFLTKRTIFILLGVVVLVEVVWALWALTRPLPITQSSAKATEKPPAPKVRQTIISLSTPKNELKVGEKGVVSINVSSDASTDGTDLIINFDPKLLSVETISKTKEPVALGAIYTDYPANSLDSKKGQIAVSGVSTKLGGIVPNGLFGSITFVAKASGHAKILLEYNKGSTIDSNVIEAGTGKDVLEKVEGVEFNIIP